ncbi:helix-turn-helix domain-containing protein [Chitinophaga sp. ARDCPP14]|uniref:AraC family transcriptional regulator n=1 Tax=Chitinophaga sp. ARDCPP14 TaxID=3391139 RepID=UPI003F528FF5
MKVQTLTPPPAIADYVSNIVVLENNSMFYEAVLPLIANGYPSITFQLTDPARMLSTTKKSHHLVLYGQNTRPIRLYTAGEITVIAYFLYPFMLPSLFGYNAKELTDQGIDLSYDDPAREMSLKEQLLNTPSLNGRLELMNNYVLTLVRSKKIRVNETISFATRLIQKNKGTLLMNDLQKEVYTTERTLQRLFEQHIGLTPKMYSRICQFNAAFRQLSQNNFSDMIDVALENGYADQSHLIRAFKDFTHYSPLEYVKQANNFPG